MDDNEPTPYFVDTYDLTKLVLFKTKSSYSVSVRTFNNGQLDFQKLIFSTPLMKSPFGVEIYNYKEILNLEFTGSDANNEMHNFYCQMKQLDKFFGRLCHDTALQDQIKLSNAIREELKNKIYTPIIKERPGKFDPLLRTHLKKSGKNIQTQLTKNKIFVPFTQLKDKLGKFTIEVGSMWVTDKTYGLTIYVITGEL